MLRRLPLHPLAVAAVLVLVVWVANVDDVAASTVVPTAATAALVALVATMLAAVLLRDLRRGALVGSVATLAIVGHGHVWGTGAQSWTVVVDAVVLGLVAWRARVVDDDTAGRWTATANGLGLVAVAACGALVGLGSAPAAAPPMPVPEVVAGDGPQRDLLWIVPDRYGGPTSLSTAFGIDELPLLDELRDRGFVVAEDARANYPRTALSLAAQLNLDLLDGPASGVAAGSRSSSTPLNPLLRDHAVGRLFTDAGYRYTHVGSWWEPTATADAATDVVRADRRTEFGRAAEQLSIVPVLDRSLGELPTEERARHRLVAQVQFDELERIARELVEDTEDPPRLVVAHVALPHEPYVFAADGGLVTVEQELARSEAVNFAAQLAYLDRRLLDVIDILDTAAPGEGPVVLLQADEGPHPSGYRSRTWVWEDATTTDLVGKLQILAAVRVPGDPGAVGLESGVSGVNVARRTVAAALGGRLEDVADRSFVYPTPDDLYTFVDVTDVLDRAISDD